MASSGPDWLCVEPQECCTNPGTCLSASDCCSGYDCYNGECGVTPSQAPITPSQPSQYVCSNTAYIGGEEGNCVDLCNMISGDPTFAPWEITGTSIDIKCGDQNGWKAATSTCFFDLIGNVFENGGLGLDVTGLTVGQLYSLVVNYGLSSETTQAYNLYIDIDAVLSYTASAIPGIDNWNLIVYTFQATSTSHRVDLYTDTGFDEMGAYIDSPRIYSCVSTPKPWCFESHSSLSDCTAGATAIDYQSNPCGCGVQELNGCCVMHYWNFSVAKQCSPDDGTGAFGSCELQGSSGIATRAYIGECVEPTTPSYTLLYQPPNASVQKRSIPSTLYGFPVLDYLAMQCGQCIALPGTVLSAKVDCVSGSVRYFIDTGCVYPVSSQYTLDQYAAIEYSTDYLFLLTATDSPEKCEMVSLGNNCSVNTQVNTTIEHSCWSENTYLPYGTFYNTTYRSFRINCPSRVVQFYLTNDCTGPVQISSNQAPGCRIPVPGVNISVDDSLICGCGLNKTSPTPTPTPTPTPAPETSTSAGTTVGQTSAASSTTQITSVVDTSTSVSSSGTSQTSDASSIAQNVSHTETLIGSSTNQITSVIGSSAGQTSTPVPTPTPTPTPSADACFREYENLDCTGLLYSQNLTANVCNDIQALSPFGAQFNTSLITTYLTTSCTTQTNAFGFNVCILLSSPFSHSGMFILGDCNGAEITPTFSVSSSQMTATSAVVPSNGISSQVVGTSSPVITGDSTIQTTGTGASNGISTTPQTTTDLSTSQPSPSGNEFYLPLHFCHIQAATTGHAT